MMKIIFTISNEQMKNKKYIERDNNNIQKYNHPVQDSKSNVIFMLYYPFQFYNKLRIG